MWGDKGEMCGETRVRCVENKGEMCGETRVRCVGRQG